MTVESDNPTTPERDERIASEVHKRGLGYGAILAEEVGYFPPKDDEDHPRPSGVKPKRSHAYHGGGKSRPDRTTGADESRKELNKHNPVTGMTPEEQSAQAHARAAEARSFITGDDRIQSIQDEVDDRIPIDPDNRAKSLERRERTLTASLRTYFDRQK